MYKVKKSLNNGALLAIDEAGNEVIIVGKGIGFNVRPNDSFDAAFRNDLKIFRKTDVETYGRTLSTKDEEMIANLEKIFLDIEQENNVKLSKSFFMTILDHIFFTLDRYNDSLIYNNPFNEEINILYPKEYEYSKRIIDSVNKIYGLSLPESETGLLTIHIRSALENNDLSETRKQFDFINDALEMIENSFDLKLSRNSIYYRRIVVHLSCAYERAKDKLEIDNALTGFIKKNYKKEFKAMKKIAKSLSDYYDISISDEEVGYLVLHIFRYYPEN